ncbi:MAG: long-chain fatty acid--CoA ligase [Anaerolineae bacterium]|nr:MAG: long-chain fatty acid--CoA ligase [Anaerolineae bacterium]
MYHFDWIKRHAERTPDKLALFDANTNQSFTYAQFNERADRLASFMYHQLNLRKGDRVSILAQNSANYYELLFACSRMGAILNTLNWRLAAPELEYILSDCRPKLLVYEPEYSQTVTLLRSGIDCDHYIVMSRESSSGEITYESAISRGSGDGVEIPRLSYDDIWAILYTSGTTGRPKGAQVTFGNFFYNAVGMGLAIDLTSQDINLNVLPTFHAGGLGLYAMPTFHAGGTVIVMRSFDMARLLSLIEEWQVSVILLVPAMYLMLSQFEDLNQYDLSSVRSWGSGGSSLPPSLVTEFASRDIIIQQGFGMTETGPTVFIITKEDALRKAGSVGKPVLHTDVLIKDKDGNVLGPNEVGELCIRGGNVTTGYWKNPEATRKAIIDGWLHSGDAAKYDEEGFYYIVDRWKDMFISGGENVYPAEVENVIYQHPAVAEVAIIGMPHPKWDEVGLAVVVVKEDHQLTEEELFDFCQGKLARYKIPKSVIFTDTLPRTAAGKVLKRQLKTQYVKSDPGNQSLFQC